MIPDRAATFQLHGTGRGRLGKRTRGNRHAAEQLRPPIAKIAEGVSSLGRRAGRILRTGGRLLAFTTIAGGAVYGGSLALDRLVDAPWFALREIDVSPTAHVRRAEVVALLGVAAAERLLALDPDHLAARVAAHPWVAEVRVARRLPSTLSVEIRERRAAAVVALGNHLYLIDERGRPFKRATTAEADGHVVITGLEPRHHREARQATEAAFRQALALIAAYQIRRGRPRLSEVNIDTWFGFSLFLFEGGGEIRLGRGELGKKLARLDRILEAVAESGAGAGTVRTVHLDGASGRRVPVLLAEPGS